jgi:hypothetical protein
MPVATWDQYKIPFVRWSFAIIGVHDAVTFNHYPKLFAIRVTMAIVHGSRWHYGPTHQQIVRSRLCFIYRKLDLHVDPPFISA